MRVCLSCGGESELVPDADCPDCGGPSVPVREQTGSMSGRVLGGKYVILKPLGRGGMGSVYLAKHRVLDKMVAVKVQNLHLTDNPTALRRFYEEAKNAGRLEHPHNVKVFDFGHEEDGVTFLVMEIVRGHPLFSAGFPMGAKRALALVDQVAGALDEAHSLGLVHRDLKPNNIMLTKVDGKDYARVLDYGIAKSSDGATSLTRSGAIVGTPEYLSPEQATGEKVDRRSDIYSLGVVLYEMVTGELPFTATSAMGHVYAHIHHTPRPANEFAKIPESVSQLVHECLAKDAKLRPQSMAELRARIGRIIDGDEALSDRVEVTSQVRVRPTDAPLEHVTSDTIADPFTPSPGATAPAFDRDLTPMVVDRGASVRAGTVIADGPGTDVLRARSHRPLLIMLAIGLLAGAVLAIAIVQSGRDREPITLPPQPTTALPVTDPTPVVPTADMRLPNANIATLVATIGEAEQQAHVALALATAESNMAHMSRPQPDETRSDAEADARADRERRRRERREREERQEREERAARERGARVSADEVDTQTVGGSAAEDEAAEERDRLLRRTQGLGRAGEDP